MGFSLAELGIESSSVEERRYRGPSWVNERLSAIQVVCFSLPRVLEVTSTRASASAIFLVLLTLSLLPSPLSHNHL